MARLPLAAGAAPNNPIDMLDMRTSPALPHGTAAAAVNRPESGNSAVGSNQKKGCGMIVVTTERGEVRPVAFRHSVVRPHGDKPGRDG